MNESKVKDLRPDGENFYISLSKLTGKAIKDVLGYPATDYGEAAFKPCVIVFADDSRCGVEGEHDYPYLTPFPKWDIPGLDQDTLNELSEESEQE